MCAHELKRSSNAPQKIVSFRHTGNNFPVTLVDNLYTASVIVPDDSLILLPKESLNVT